VRQREKIQEVLRQMMRTGLALLSAALLALCFPAGELWGLAWIALVPLLMSVDRNSPGLAFLRGYAAGFLFFICTLFWIHHVTSLGLILLSAYLALYWALFALGASWASVRNLGPRVVFLALFWTVLEYLRAELFTGFGWASLAHTQSTNILFVQMADITGVYGLSCVMVASSVLMAAGIRSFLRGEKPFLGFHLAAWGVALVLTAVLIYGGFRLNAPVFPSKVRVALIQANVSLADYWDPGLKPFVVEKHLALSREAMAEKPSLIIWPETAFPQFIWDHPDLFQKVRDFAREHEVELLLGAVTMRGGAYFNSAVLIDKFGQVAQAYNKQHLVLFGEYIPFRQEFRFLERLVPIDDFTAGKDNVLFSPWHLGGFSALICFEDTIPHLARQAARDGALFLVNLTNDGWFGASRASRMHLDNAVYRAVENRIPLIRATNTGMSCSIAITGEVKKCVTGKNGEQTMVEGYVVTEIPGLSRTPTFYTKYGDIFAMLCFIGILGMFIFMKRNPEA
jgi:apolipoprotein N-acyltransferase